LKKYLTPLNIIFALEIVVVALAATGLIPREAILVWTGLAIFYMIFSPLRDSLWLVVASIPLFASLPILDSFDTLANWRILIAALFLCLFFKQGVSLSLTRNNQGRWRVRENLKHYALEYLALAFLVVAALSIAVAGYKILALKKLLFLINILLLFLITRNLTRSKEEILRVWQAAAVGGLAVIAVAMVQFIAVLFVPLFSFWQFWTNKVINAFYGQNLAELLSYANTWFAYYKSAPPTLRLFSVFPDSHSFAMFLMIAVPIFLALAFYFKNNRRLKILFWTATTLALFGIVFSGSRGAWLSVVPVIILAIYFWGLKLEPLFLKKAMRAFLIFVLFFIMSTIYPPVFYTFQSWQTGEYSSSTLSFFERARSISDMDDVSNKGRLEIWRNSLLSLKEHPLLGVGLGNFISVIGEKTSAVKKGASAHNLYLDFAAEIGVPGTLLLIAMFIDILRTSWLVWRRANEPYFRFFGLLFGLYFLWVLGYSFFDVVLLNDKVLLLFMVSAATLYSLKNIIFDSKKI